MAHVPKNAHTAVIIEDDPDVRSVLDEVFRAAGFATVLVPSGLNGVSAVEEHQPAITTLDINLPGIDGFEVARRIRAVSQTHIIMISALAEEADLVLGLGAGADDYLTKPFRPRELRARIDAYMRRHRDPLGLERLTGLFFEESRRTPAPVGAEMLQPAQSLSVEMARTTARDPSAKVLSDVPAATSKHDVWYAHRDIRLELHTRTVLVAQREVELTPTEFELLATLLESRRRVRSKSDLALVLRGDDAGTSFFIGEPDKRAVESHMANLRRKIGDNPIEPIYVETVRGVGYRLTPEKL